MDPKIRRGLGVIAASAFAAAVFCGIGPAGAQEPKGATATRAPRDVTPPAPPGEGSTLVIVVEGASNENKDNVQRRFRLGAGDVLHERGQLAPNADFPKENVVVEALTKDDFDRLSRLIEGGSGRAGAIGRFAKEDLSGRWSLDLGKPVSLKSLVVEYAAPKGGKVTRTTYEVGDKIGSQARFTEVTPGRYVVDIRDDPEAIPKDDAQDGTAPARKGEARLDDRHPRPMKFIAYPDDSESEPITFSLPEAKTYWEITLTGFADTDHAALFNKLEQEGRFANPLVKKKTAARKFVLGSITVVTVLGTVTVTENTVSFSFIKPPGAKTPPTRVLMKFPLTEAEAQEELELYRQFKEFQLPGEIKDRVPAAPDTKLSPRASGGKAKWYEIPAVPEGISYDRRFRIDRVADWKADRASSEPAWYLLVWELDDGKGTELSRQAYLITDPVTKDSWPIKAEAADGWPFGLGFVK